MTARTGDLTRWRLLRSSIRIFAEKGFEATTTREITQEAGVSIALIWFHFGGKDGLYLEAVRFSGRLAGRLVSKLPEVPGPGDSGPAAAMALRSLSKMIIRAALPSPGSQSSMRGLGRAAVSLVARELSRPRAGAEAAAAQAFLPVAAYLDHCLRALRPDLDEQGRAWLSLGIQSMLLLPVTHPGLLSTPWGPQGSRVDPESFSAHILAMSLHETRPPLDACTLGNPLE